MNNFDPETQIAIIWSIDDVKGIRPDLTDEESMKVLREVKRTHDATIGVSWETLKIIADILYPAK